MSASARVVAWLVGANVISLKRAKQIPLNKVEKKRDIFI